MFIQVFREWIPSVDACELAPMVVSESIHSNRSSRINDVVCEKYSPQLVILFVMAKPPPRITD